jgi:hypothetical protein
MVQLLMTVHPSTSMLATAWDLSSLSLSSQHVLEHVLHSPQNEQRHKWCFLFVDVANNSGRMSVMRQVKC